VLGTRSFTSRLSAVGNLTIVARTAVRVLLSAWWGGYIVAVWGVAITTAVIGVVFTYTRIANISMLYLIVVLAVGALFGSGPAVLAAVLAFLAFDFFFVPPVYTLTVSDPEEWVALLLFLLTAFVTGQLAAGQRRRALEAEARRREASLLYDIVRLMGELELEEAMHAVAERLRQELGLAAVVIDVSDPRGYRVAVGEEEARKLVESVATAPKHLLQEGPVSRGGAGRSARW